MKRRRRYSVLVVVVICCVLALGVRSPGVISAGSMPDEQYDIRSLEGLRGVAVRMVRRYSAFEESRLRPDPIRDEQLRSQVESILRGSGIIVFEDAGEDWEIAELIITVNTWEAKLLSQCILQVKTEVYEPSELVRDRRLRVAALRHR
jgi:hypothetical protein